MAFSRREFLKVLSGIPAVAALPAMAGLLQAPEQHVGDGEALMPYGDDDYFIDVAEDDYTVKLDGQPILHLRTASMSSYYDQIDYTSMHNTPPMLGTRSDELTLECYDAPHALQEKFHNRDEVDVELFFKPLRITAKAKITKLSVEATAYSTPVLMTQISLGLYGVKTNRDSL